jgi:hypothetical protein
MSSKKSALLRVHTRLFRADVLALKRIAGDRGLPWQIELRLLVNKALKEQKLSLVELEPPKSAPLKAPPRLK